MYLIRKLGRGDESSLAELIRIIEDNLTVKEWWLPIAQTARDHFLDETWTVFYGVFDHDKLIAASALFLNEYEYGESARCLALDRDDKIGEIGRCMVSPSFRGQNLMWHLNINLLREAENLGIKYLVATAHPDNLPSNASLQKLGMKKEKFIIKNGNYPRNVYLMELHAR